MRESAVGFQTRDRWLLDWSPRECWSVCGPLDVAFTLEALGAAPEGFERVLRLVAEIKSGDVPAGLPDVAPGFRIGVVVDPTRHSGEALGRYGAAVIMAWTIAPQQATWR